MKYVLDKLHPTLRKMVGTAFPTFRKKRLVVYTDSENLTSDYIEYIGSITDADRIEVKAVSFRDDIKTIPFDKSIFINSTPENGLRPGIAMIIKYSSYNLTYRLAYLNSDLEIYINEESAEGLLPRIRSSLPEDEMIVLEYTYSYRSSYNRIDRYRIYKAVICDKVITRYRWEEAKDRLIKKGLLTARGAITGEGITTLQKIKRQS